MADIKAEYLACPIRPLTETGKSLMPTLTALIAWGKEHFDEVVTD